MVIVSPGLVKASAFDRRLIMICLMRFSSARTSPRPSGHSTFSTTLFFCAGWLRELLGGMHDVRNLDIGQVERHRARLDDGEVENVVHHVEQRVGRFQNALRIFVLLRIEVAEHFGFEDFAEAEDVRQRRAQLIGDVADEFRLQTVRRFERVVALAQRQFHADRIRHVDIGEQARAIGQRHDGVVDHRAVRTVRGGPSTGRARPRHA